MEPAAKPDNSDVGITQDSPVGPAVGGAATQDGFNQPNVSSRTPAGAPPLAGDPPYYAGTWHDIPLFKCPYCVYTALATHGGSGAIELHILNQIDRGHQSHAAALELKEG